MSSKEIIYNEDARQRMRAGIDKVANAVKVTLGPRGRNVVMRKNWGAPNVTKDGVTVAKEIVLEDHFEDVGAQLCKQVASRTDDIVGDGTTTATVLTQAMVAEGMKYIATGANAVSVKRGIEKAASKVSEFVETQKKKISYDNFEEIKHVATISGNDPEVGKIVAEAFTKVGANGVVTFEEAKSTETTLTVTEGFEFDRGYCSPYFVTDPNKMKCEYEDCLILFWDKRLTNPNEMVPLLNAVAGTAKPLLIVADDVEAEALSLLALNLYKGIIKVVAVKAPGFGERKKNLLSDMALLTGGTFFSEELGKKLEKVSVTELGQAKRIIVTKDSTTIIGGAGDKDKVAEHIETLKKQVQEVESSWDKEKLIERVAKLCGSVAIIRVGAAIESEMKEKKYRYEDAISAAKAALEQGVVPGGGITLYKARKALSKLKTEDADEAFGVSIVIKALEVPMTTILHNAGFSMDVKNKIFSAVDKNKGYDGRNGKVIPDMIKAGIVDPAKVVKSAIEGSASVAGLFLTSEAVIIDTPTEKGANSAPANPYGGMY